MLLELQPRQLHWEHFAPWDNETERERSRVEKPRRSHGVHMCGACVPAGLLLQGRQSISFTHDSRTPLTQLRPRGRPGGEGGKYQALFLLLSVSKGGIILFFYMRVKRCCVHSTSAHVASEGTALAPTGLGPAPGATGCCFPARRQALYCD